MSCPRSTLAHLGGLASLAALLLAAGCAPAPHPADWLHVHEATPGFLLERPARDPAVAADAHGRVALTFVTRDSLGTDLWLAISRDSGLTYGEPIRVNQRPGSVASYPEGRPIAAFGPGGALAVAWAARRDHESRAVDLMVRASGDGGATFGAAVVVNEDAPDADGFTADARWRSNQEAYHGFPALTFLPDGSLFAAWLDERHIRAGDNPSLSSLYAAVSLDGGESWGENLRVADGVCACCRPVAGSNLAGEVALAYRSGAGDLRDPALAVSFDGGRSFPVDTVVSADDWLLEGCPDQGPALSWNLDQGGYYAWYTGAGRRGVYVMPWRPHGVAGVKRRMADSLARAQSPRLATLGRSALLAVEAQPADDTTRTVIAVRGLEEDGSLTPWSFLGAHAQAGWVAGLDRRTALACWVERHDGVSRVRVVRLRRAGR